MRKLVVTNPLGEPTYRLVIHTLRLPQGSRGLDAGCGIGYQALLLAEAVGPAGHVTGIDLSPEFLAKAGEIVKKAGMAEQVFFQEADVSNLPL